MNVPTVEITRETALEKLIEYRALNKKQKTVEDERLISIYAAVKKGGHVIDVAEAFKFAGLNDKGHPRLAIARADQKVCWFHPRSNFETSWNDNNIGAGGFSPEQWWNNNYKAKNFVLPRNTFDDAKLTRNKLKTFVPHIPPKIRPAILIENFHILFEVNNWQEYPVDPYLLRRIHGNLFIVVAEWELTPLEASLLSAIKNQ